MTRAWLQAFLAGESMGLMSPRPAVAPAAALEGLPVIKVTMTVAAMDEAPAGAILEVMAAGPAETALVAVAAETAPAATEATQAVGATVAAGAAVAEAMEAGTVTRQTAQ